MDALDEIAPKNHVSKEQLRAELGLDNNRIDFNDKEDWSQQEKNRTRDWSYFEKDERYRSNCSPPSC